MIRLPHRILVTLALPALLGSCRDGCQRRVAGLPAPADTLLGALPADTRFVVSADLAIIRASKLWTALSAVARDRPRDQAIIDEFTARTGVDPFRQIHRIVAAFPEEARKNGAFAVIVDGEGFDEKRLVTYGRDQAQLRGHDIQQRVAGGRTLWASPGPDRTAGFFVGARRFVLGAGGWAEQLAELAAGAPGTASAAGNHELGALCGRIDSSQALWFAALVPAETRHMLQADPRFGAAASVARMAGAVGLGPGLTIDLVAELSNDADARALADKILAFKRDAKSSPQVLMLGLGSYLDTLTAVPDGPNVRLRLALSASQTDDLLARLGGLARLRGQ